jgi:hypothetical protein
VGYGVGGRVSHSASVGHIVGGRVSHLASVGSIVGFLSTCFFPESSIGGDDSVVSRILG